MLSEEEKREMLEDAESAKRRENFRVGRERPSPPESLDEYISFLQSVQKLFGPFKISQQPTIASANKL